MSSPEPRNQDDRSDRPDSGTVPSQWRLTAILLIATTLLIGSPAVSCWAGEPPDYYTTASGLSGESLRLALHAIIDDHEVIPYESASQLDVHDAIDVLDEDPSNPDNVVLMYSGYSVPKSTWPDYNREHLWPVSLGATDGTVPNSDLFILYACDADVNSLRNNRFYDNCRTDCLVPAEAPGCRYDFTTWQPSDEWRGNIARALFYMDVRYEGDAVGEPDLVLRNAAAATGCDCMAVLDMLLVWNELDPVDARELERNDQVFSLYQGNRNPFVDHPEWVAEIWGAIQLDGIAWINEFHYDNSGADVNEGIEVAGPAGTSLLGWTIVAYNGNGFEGYDDWHLYGVIPDERDGHGALWFPFEPLQNGSPDGLALVDPEGGVEQFISYEGTIPAVDGPAMGMVSIDVGVEEVAPPIGQSLQLTGLGSAAQDFSWSGPAAHSRGLLNAGQDFATGMNFVRGDCNDDGGFDIADAIAGLGYLFSSGGVPCLNACDTNADHSLDIADMIYSLGSLFSMGPPPLAPHPDCGVDPGAGALDCASFTSCP